MNCKLYMGTCCWQQTYFICSNEVFYQLDHTSNGFEIILHVVDTVVLCLSFTFLWYDMVWYSYAIVCYFYAMLWDN